MLVALLIFAATAQAQPRARSGKAHLVRGLGLYRAGQYRAAIAQFEAGYAQLPRPAFLLNIAQSWRKLGQLDKAREYYLLYLHQAPADDPQRGQVMQAIAAIELQTSPDNAHPPSAENQPQASAQPSQPSAPNQPPPSAPPNPPPTNAPPQPTQAPPTQPQAQLNAQQTPEPIANVPSPPPTPEPTSRSRRVAGFAGVGLAVVGVAALATGTYFAITAEHLDSQFAHPAAGTVYDPQLLARRDTDRATSIALLAGGGALTVAGAIMAAVLLPRHARVHASAGGLAVRF